MTGHGRRTSAVAVAGVALVVAGLAAWFLQSPTSAPAPPAAGAGGAAPSAPSRAPSAAGPGSGAPTPVKAKWKPGAPRRVVIPALHVDAPVIPIRAPGGTLIPPSDPQELGWWAGGAKPGAARGSALVTGHTVHTGGGALDHLGTLERGDRVVVRTDHGRIRYDVSQVEVYSKGAVAKHARRLFSQEVPGRLVLVTCDDWDGQEYLSNAVVVAKPVTE